MTTHNESVHNLFETMHNSASYCPCCGDSKPVEEDYCLDCYLQSEDIVITAIPNYFVGYVSDITTFTP